MTVIAALLTLVGYSMNDTIVIFDRIRENLKMLAARTAGERDERAVNQTLSRTVMTSGLTFLTVIALFLFGGPVLHGFSFALVCGITRWNVFFGFHRQPDRAVLAQLCRIKRASRRRRSRRWLHGRPQDRSQRSASRPRRLNDRGGETLHV